MKKIFKLFKKKELFKNDFDENEECNDVNAVVSCVNNDKNSFEKNKGN